LAETATSLLVLLGERLDRSELARDLVRRLDDWYERGRTQGADCLNLPWRTRSEHLGRTVCVTTPTGPTLGRLDDLNLIQGATVALPGGRRRSIPTPSILALFSVDDESDRR